MMPGKCPPGMKGKKMMDAKPGAKRKALPKPPGRMAHSRKMK